MKESQTLSACEPVGTFRSLRPNPPARILVVEDDEALRHLNVAALAHAGYHVDAAEDGDEAWQTLNAHRYDLMITDQNMPKVSGLELLKKLHAGHMDVPVIMATGTLPTAVFDLNPWLQPAATLLKPYTLEELLQTVGETLRETDRAATSPQLLRQREVTESKISPAGMRRPDPENFTHRILVVDENQDLRQMYAEVLVGPGYQVDEAADGAAGWAALQAHPYQLLITEHNLPKLTGVELVRKARAAHLAMPIVMTADRLPLPELDCDPALQLTATLMKPFAVETLLNTVKSALRATLSPRPPITSGLQFS